jgi:hypothetical protein
MVGDLVSKNRINVGFKDGPNFVFVSDIPLRGTHCLGDSDIQFAFAGNQPVRSEDLGQPVSRSLPKDTTTFSAAQRHA